MEKSPRGDTEPEGRIAVRGSFHDPEQGLLFNSLAAEHIAKGRRQSMNALRHTSDIDRQVRKIICRVSFVLFPVPRAPPSSSVVGSIISLAIFLVFVERRVTDLRFLPDLLNTSNRVALSTVETSWEEYYGEVGLLIWSNHGSSPTIFLANS